MKLILTCLKKTIPILLIILIIPETNKLAQENLLIESLAEHLKGLKLTAELLEQKHSCMTLEEMLKKGLSNINNLEKAVISARKNTRAAGLLPEISAWGKYKNDEKLYLYQRNNVAVGKDYITVGPDDNNTTYGDLSSFEVGARIRFDLTKLLYNSDVIRFSDQEQKLYFLRIEMIEKLSYIYYFNAMFNALKLLKNPIPEEKMLIFEIMNKKHNGWLKSYTGFDLYECGVVK